MSEHSLFVGNVAQSVDQLKLQKEFAKFGKCSIDMRSSGTSDRSRDSSSSISSRKKYAFVAFDDVRDAEEAKQGMNKKILGGVEISVEWSKKSGRFDENETQNRSKSSRKRSESRDRSSRRRRGGSRSRSSRRRSSSGHRRRERKGRSRSKSGGRKHGRKSSRSESKKRGRRSSRSDSKRRSRRSHRSESRKRRREDRRHTSQKDSRKRRERSESPKRKEKDQKKSNGHRKKSDEKERQASGSPKQVVEKTNEDPNPPPVTEKKESVKKTETEKQVEISSNE